MSEELKACPFCGGAACLRGEGRAFIWKAIAQCTKCKASLEYVDMGGTRVRAEKEVANIWNARWPNV